MNLDPADTREGVRYRVAWNDCCVSGGFEAALESKNYEPDPPQPESFLASLTFANGVTISGDGVAITEAGEAAPRLRNARKRAGCGCCSCRRALASLPRQ